MSRVYWHSREQTAELHGSERAWLRCLADGPAIAAWDLQHRTNNLERADAILSLVPTGERGYLQGLRDEAMSANTRNHNQIAAGGRNQDWTEDWTPVTAFVSAMSTALAVDGLPLDVAGVSLHTTNVGLNTALVAGSEPVRLAAKLQRWCEAHCWVEGPDREWLASTIDAGLDAGLYRRGFWMPSAEGNTKVWSDQSWDDVLALLRSVNSGPVVLSYSVTDDFPNPEIAGWAADVPDDWRPEGYDEDDWSAESDEVRHRFRSERACEMFWELTDDQRWERAVTGRRERRPWAQLSPDTLTQLTFDHPVTVYDLFAPDRDERVARAAARTAPQRSLL